ncbi:MAG: class I SAM-dependent methyltransferase [Acidimicrobiales bacterium]
MADVDYLLGHDEAELQRLEEQAQQLASATDAILTIAGIEPGMRVLDLGTGAGDVAFAVGELVGTTGSVVGIDQSAGALAHAEQRGARRGLNNIRFVHDDLQTATVAGPFDAVVGRLVLLYTPDPAAIVERYAALLRAGGVYVAMEYEMAAAGMLPPTAFSGQVVAWITEAFRRSGLDPLLGARLPDVLRRAGLGEPATLGLQTYVQPGDPAGPRMIAAMVRTLLPVLERTGIATASEIGIDTFEERVAAEQAAHDAVFKPPTLVGSWARVG